MLHSPFLTPFSPLVNDLYHHIHKFGLSNVLLTEPYWRTIKDFPKRYHKFSGNYNKILKGEFFKFDVFEGKLELDLKLAPPQITQEVSFLFLKNVYSALMIEVLLSNVFCFGQCSFCSRLSSTRKNTQNASWATHSRYQYQTCF